MIKLIELKAGDVFCTRNPMALGRIVNAIQKFWSHDNKSEYSHAGIIIDNKGTTFESLWTLKRQNIWGAYGGEKVIIARFEAQPEKKHDAIDLMLRGHEGQRYPFWRRLLHVFPPLAKIHWANHPICSELVAKYENLAKVRHDQWAGTNPDTLADEWRHWKGFKIIFEGVLPK